MATEKVSCQYCNNQLSDKYMIERHQKTSKLCIRIQNLQPMKSNDEIRLTIEEKFDIDEFNDPIKNSQNKFIYDFIYQHFINENTYITTNIEKYIGKYNYNNNIVIDEGYNFIKKIYDDIIIFITTKKTNNRGLFYIKKNTKSKICNLPVITKTFFANKTSYKKTTKTQTQKPKKFTLKNSFKKIIQQDPSGGIAQDIQDDYHNEEEIDWSKEMFEIE